MEGRQSYLLLHNVTTWSQSVTHKFSNKKSSAVLNFSMYWCWMKINKKWILTPRTAGTCCPCPCELGHCYKSFPWLNYCHFLLTTVLSIKYAMSFWPWTYIDCGQNLYFLSNCLLHPHNWKTNTNIITLATIKDPIVKSSSPKPGLPLGSSV